MLIRIQEGKNDPQKQKSEDFRSDVLYGGLGISKLQFLLKFIFLQL
jgi:hypothetical protein